MSTTAITTITKMMESLPDNFQDRVVEYLREYIEDLRDEMQWENSFQKTQPQLIAAAKRARQEIAEGKGKLLKSMNFLGVQNAI